MGQEAQIGGARTVARRIPEHGPMTSKLSSPITGISKKLLFAIEAVLDVAYFTEDNDRRIQAGAIPTLRGIPRRYLEPVLQALVHAGILEGVRGPRGGYRLGRGSTDITLADIAAAVRTTEQTDQFFDLPPVSALDQDVVRPTLMELATTWSRQLEKIAIGDLCSRARRAGINPDPH